MLVLFSGKCSVCNDAIHMDQQSVDLTCINCSYSLIACTVCKKNGCPNCGGKLLDVREKFEKDEGPNVRILF